MVSSVYDAILFQRRLHPHAVAVVAGSAELSYSRFCADIEKVTRILAGHRIVSGARVAVNVVDPYLHWLAVLALTRIGCVSASTGMFAGELELLAPQLVLVDHGASSWAGPKLEVTRDWLGAQAEALPAVMDRQPQDDAPCRIILSSGTTGAQKKVLITHGQLHQRLAGVAITYASEPPMRVLSAVGFVTVAGFVSALHAWCSGRAVVLLVPQAGQTLPQLVRESRASAVFVSPAQLAGMLEQLPDGGWPWQPVAVYTGGSGLSQAVSDKARLRLTQSLYLVYGSTETGTISVGLAAQADGRPGFSGHVVPSALAQVVDGDGRPVAHGVTGQLRLRAAGMATGYLDDDGNAADGAFRDGWFHPGDLAALDDEGTLTLHGRVREVMNLGGFKLSPLLLEQRLAPCPDVLDLAAFCVPDAQGVDTPWVAIVAAQGFQDDALARLYAAAFPGLPPLQVARIDRIPRNLMGKVLRTELRALTQQALAGPRLS